MSDERNTVFISYRRDVSWSLARSIFQDLHYNGYDVFMDVESIHSGEFEQIILGQIAARMHFIVVLTPGSVKRCAEPGDWLRREIECALDVERNIVPVTEGFDFSTEASFLTGKLARLGRYNALELTPRTFPYGMEDLRTNYLKPPSNVTVVPTPVEDRGTVQRVIRDVVSKPEPTEAQLEAERCFERSASRSENDNTLKIRDLSEAIRLDPDFVQAYIDRGLSYYYLGRFDEALDDFDEAIRRDAQSGEAYANRALVHLSGNDTSSAFTDCDKALEMNPGLAVAYANRAAVRNAEADFNGALDDSSRAVEINPRLASAFVQRAYARVLTNDRGGALADANEAIRLGPRLSGAYVARGDVLSGKFDAQRALADYDRAILHHPNRTSMW